MVKKNNVLITNNYKKRLKTAKKQCLLELQQWWRNAIFIVSPTLLRHVKNAPPIPHRSRMTMTIMMMVVMMMMVTMMMVVVMRMMTSQSWFSWLLYTTDAADE